MSLYGPLVARTKAVHAPIAPVAYDCVKLIFVRDGSAVLLSEFGEKPVRVGDVIALGASTLCGSEPEGSATVTTLYLDRDYVVDQIFWQHAALLSDRLDAKDLAEDLYSEPAQILRLGENRAGMLTPWLDELVCLTLDGPCPKRFYRMQALLFAILDVVMPYVSTTPTRRSHSQRRTTISSRPGEQRFAPLRDEARQAAELLRSAPAARWTLNRLAESVHLSPSQLGRVFAEAYGKSPMSYLATVRAEGLARLLRETDLPITEAMEQVGWRSRGHAARTFSQALGVTPSRYRELARQRAAA
ncbi:helix-turn-helix transcriptional regulator [Nesterenkonia sp. PF2B19]|uniref:helix-turn-helix transcriptional regulator n=1 Tax=Nesterenkonia sp. PF2B19 TaxID=1881858 RepID=UPI000872056B|nr:helix-turn-helix transcriptional regulator [Nesterenkonia sp. PF2B19]OSM44559.1 AraC family transcriptional regulator [Nesterenkonia sp. PF2B19]